ncbi:MAG: hypothetical protein JST54_27355 [Deltaproteobacteria bacterium]|nr:hypothetical protein [Deltaproteobacteria bacterium]
MARPWLAAVLDGLVELASLAPRDRLLHERGVTYEADAQPLAGAAGLGLLAERLAGPARVRLSGALWRDRELPDLLAIAIRFRGREDREQDMLFATVRQPLTTLFAPATTDVHDFLANDYYAVSAFEADDVGTLRFRLVPEKAHFAGPTREERLARAAAVGAARLELQGEVAPGTWVGVTRVTLGAPVDEKTTLRFDPFRDGQGVRPRGPVQALRRLLKTAMWPLRTLAVR